MRTGLALLIAFVVAPAAAHGAPRVTVATPESRAEALSFSGCTHWPGKTMCGSGPPGGPDLVAGPGATLTVTFDADVLVAAPAGHLSSEDGRTVPLSAPMWLGPRTYAFTLPLLLPLPREFVVFARYDEGYESGERAWSVRLVAPSGTGALLGAQRRTPVVASLPFR